MTISRDGEGNMIYIAMCRFPLCARSVSLARRMTRWRGERQKSLHYGGANCPSPPGTHDLHARTALVTYQPPICFFSQTSEGEDGPTETDGQREHHHRHGKGERTGNLLRAEGGRETERGERASEGAWSGKLPKFYAASSLPTSTWTWRAKSRGDSTSCPS